MDDHTELVLRELDANSVHDRPLLDVFVHCRAHVERIAASHLMTEYVALTTKNGFVQFVRLSNGEYRLFLTHMGTIPLDSSLRCFSLIPTTRALLGDVDVKHRSAVFWLLYSLSYSNELLLVDMNAGNVVVVRTCHTRPSVTYCDDRYVVCGEGGGAVTLWTVTKFNEAEESVSASPSCFSSSPQLLGTPLWHSTTLAEDMIVCLCVCQTRLICCSADFSCVVADIHSGAALSTVMHSFDAVLSVLPLNLSARSTRVSSDSPDCASFLLCQPQWIAYFTESRADSTQNTMNNNWLGHGGKNDSTSVPCAEPHTIEWLYASGLSLDVPIQCATCVNNYIAAGTASGVVLLYQCHTDSTGGGSTGRVTEVMRFDVGYGVVGVQFYTQGNDAQTDELLVVTKAGDVWKWSLADLLLSSSTSAEQDDRVGSSGGTRGLEPRSPRELPVPVKPSARRASSQPQGAEQGVRSETHKSNSVGASPATAALGKSRFTITDRTSNASQHRTSSSPARNSQESAVTVVVVHVDDDDDDDDDLDVNRLAQAEEDALVHEETRLGACDVAGEPLRSLPSSHASPHTCSVAALPTGHTRALHFTEPSGVDSATSEPNSSLPAPPPASSPAAQLCVDVVPTTNEQSAGRQTDKARQRAASSDEHDVAAALPNVAQLLGPPPVLTSHLRHGRRMDPRRIHSILLHQDESNQAGEDEPVVAPVELQTTLLLQEHYTRLRSASHACAAGDAVPPYRTEDAAQRHSLEEDAMRYRHPVRLGRYRLHDRVFAHVSPSPSPPTAHRGKYVEDSVMRSHSTRRIRDGGDDTKASNGAGTHTVASHTTEEKDEDEDKENTPHICATDEAKNCSSKQGAIRCNAEEVKPTSAAGSTRDGRAQRTVSPVTATLKDDLIDSTYARLPRVHRPLVATSSPPDIYDHRCDHLLYDTPGMCDNMLFDMRHHEMPTSYDFVGLAAMNMPNTPYMM